jgi:hypothetical protein
MWRYFHCCSRNGKRGQIDQDVHWIIGSVINIIIVRVTRVVQNRSPQEVHSEPSSSKSDLSSESEYEADEVGISPGITLLDAFEEELDDDKED